MIRAVLCLFLAALLARAQWPVEAAMAKYKVPAVSVAVMEGGKIVKAQAWGVLEAGGSAKANTETLFQAASISKPVAAMAALHMSQYGNFTLDENVNGKLKSWKVPDNPFTASEKVTLRRLLSHTAGLTVHSFRGYGEGEPAPIVLQILDGAPPANSKPIRVDLQPGNQFRYSGGGYTVAQLLMTERFGKPFPELMSLIVLRPLGMRHSTYEQPLPADRAANAARGHRADGTMVKGRWHTYPEMAAAGLWSTPSDLALFAIEVWKASRGESNRVLEKSTAVAMLTPVKEVYGLGFGVEGNGASARFAHNGSNEGFRCSLVMYRQSGNGAVIMTNGDQGAALAKKLLRAIAETYRWPKGIPAR